MIACLTLLGGYACPAPGPETVRRYAEDLGIPAEALQQLVDAYHDQSGLSNPHAAGAAILTLPELLHMRDQDTLKIGSYYRAKTIFNYQSGRRVSLGDSVSISLEADFVIFLHRYTSVEALFLIRADAYGRPRQIILVELAAIP
jgi:hypothetical protein